MVEAFVELYTKLEPSVLGDLEIAQRPLTGWLDRMFFGGARRVRTADLLHAMQALSQLSYGPIASSGPLGIRKAQCQREMVDSAGLEPATTGCKTGALPAELTVRVLVVQDGIEPSASKL